MTAKRTPELAAAMLSSDECPHNKSAIPRPQNTCTECLEAALREQAEVAREAIAAAERRGRREAGQRMMQLVCRPCRKNLSYDDEGNVSNHSTCRRIEKLAKALTGEGAPPQEQPRIGGQSDGECPHGCLHQECRT